MLISKRTRYALHGLGYIASQPRGQIVAFPEILAYLRGYANELTLSEGYIAKIFQSLSRAGLVRTEAGRSGGYRLAEDPRRMPLVRIVEAIDGPTFDSCCLLSVSDCHSQDHCGVYDIVQGAESAFLKFLRKESLATLARKMALPKKKASPASARAASSRRGAAKPQRTAAKSRGVPAKTRHAAAKPRARTTGSSSSAARRKKATARPRSARRR